MRLKRPYIPLKVRVAIAARQVSDHPALSHYLLLNKKKIQKILGHLPASKQLETLLRLLFGDEPVHLDHDPALVNRKRTARGYVPDANDPDYLVYRTKADHDIKTRVRGDGAQHSDLALRRKLKRVERNRDPKRRKAKIARRKSRWPKRRKLGGHRA